MVLVAASVAAAALGWAYSRAGKKVAPRFETALVERGRISARVTATGTLSALVTVQVGSQVSGRIQAVLADFNSAVKKGQVIARLDAQLFAASVEQARANLAVAQANVTRATVQAEQAARELGRARALDEKRLVAAADRDAAQAAFDGAQAQLLAAQAQVEQARAAHHQAVINLDYTTIVSPIQGTVISRNIDVGQTVAASLQAPTLFTIAEDLRKMQVDTSLAEADVGKLRPGMAANFTVDAYSGERWQGTVRQIRNAPQTLQNVVTYDAVIDVDNPELKLKPGMTATVTFVHAERDDVLRVPNAALRFRPPEPAAGASPRPDGGASARPAEREGREGSAGREGRAGRDGSAGHGASGPRGPGEGKEPPGQRRVWVLRDGQPAPIVIRTGITDGSMTEVLEGELKPGMEVITEQASEATKGGGGGPPPQLRSRMF